MKKTAKVLLSLALCLCMILSAGLTACGSNGNNSGNKSHKCEHVCTECGNCLTDCEEAECADKCQGHTPPHECEDVCPECHKCLTDCNEPECADKCQGHMPPHACQDICPECHKCLTDCNEPECADKCQGHTPPHACQDICPECHKCLTDCNEPECTDKCQGHTPPHACEDVCPECHKCLTDCKEPECEEKCEGHVVKAEITIPANSTYNMSISGISAGAHIIEVDLGWNSLASSASRLQAYIGANGAKSELVHSESRSSEGHNIYYTYLKIAEGDTAITFSSANQAAPLSVTVYIKNWTMPTLKADGIAVEVPINIYQTADENLIKFKLDTSITAGNYTIVINGNSAYSNSVKFYIGSRGLSTIGAAAYSGKVLTFVEDDFNTDGDIYVYLIVSGSGSSYKQLNPVSITLTPAA